MEVTTVGKKLGEWAALLTIVGVVGSLWIDREVERRMNELAIDPASAPAVVANTTRLESLGEGQVRIEGKVDAFAGRFYEFLEREANR